MCLSGISATDTADAVGLFLPASTAATAANLPAAFRMHLYATALGWIHYWCSPEAVMVKQTITHAHTIQHHVPE